MMRIATDGTDASYVKKCQDLFEQAGLTLTYLETPLETEADCIQALQGFDGFIAGGEVFSRRVMEALPSLKLISRFGLGYDKIDLAAATERGICVTNTAGTMAGGVAETALLLMLECGRRFSKYDKCMHNGIWDRNFCGQELEGKTIGILGFGNIGQKLAQYVSGFHTRLLVYDVVCSEEALAKYGAKAVDLPELAAESDYVSVHCPLLPSTRGIIDEAFLSAMKPTSFLINTSRGATVQEAALKAALRDGKIAGAGLDVFEQEPLEPGSALREMEHVVLLPHIASFTHESMRECAADVVLSLKAFLAGKTPAHCVNPDYIRHGQLN